MSEHTPTALLAGGGAFADLSPWRKVRVSGSEARSWLDALVSADVPKVGTGRARRTLLLSPTGRIRAEFAVVAPDWKQAGDALLLIQDPEQVTSILDLLQPYVLSSNVSLDDVTHHFALFAFPGHPTPPAVDGAAVLVPSCLGRGSDLLLSADEHDEVLRRLSRRLAPADTQALEEWRVTEGIPRVAIDATPDDLPQEVALAGAVSFDKGCFVGQEAVAKVRNLGHPRRVLLHLRADASTSTGEPVLVDGREVGRITSAAIGDDGGIALASVRWDAREAALRTAGGAKLVPLPAGVGAEATAGNRR